MPPDVVHRLVHLCEGIDYEILHASVGEALRDFTALVTALDPLAEEQRDE
jgi:hypothetical protein